MPPRQSKQGQACSSCHSRKIKCDIALAVGHNGPCSSCLSLGIECRPHVRKRKFESISDLPAPPATLNKPSPPNLGRPTATEQPTISPQLSYLGRADYLGSHLPINEEDASRYHNCLPGQASLKFNAAKRDVALDDIIPRSTRESLVSSFLKKCLPWMPLVDAESTRSLFDTNQRPTLVMLAVLVAGCKVSLAPRAAELGQHFYDWAKLAFYTSEEQNPVNSIIASVFLQWWNQAGPEHVSIDNSSFWLRVGVAVAHQIGLHKQPDMRHPEARLRRKLWWTLVSRDNQIATSHGRPRAIHASDCTTRSLSLGDFAMPEEDGLLFINFVQITQILGDLTQAYLRGGLQHQLRLDIEDRLSRWLRDLPPSFHLCERSTRKLAPYTFRSRQLHVPFFVALIILCREESPTSSPSVVSILSASFISGIFEEYLDWGDIAFVSPPSIFYLLVATLVQVSSHRFPSLSTRREKETRISDSAIQELKKRFATAFGAERVIKSMRRMQGHSHVNLQPLPTSCGREMMSLFDYFGPELCAQWNTVMKPPAEENEDAPHSIGERAGALPESSPEVTNSAYGIAFPPLVQETLVHSSNGLQLHDDLPFDINLGNFGAFEPDMVGQWWWSDMFADGR